MIIALPLRSWFGHLFLAGHARRQMKWRRVSEAEVLSVLDAPDRVEESIDERRNAHKLVDDRLLKVTYVDEAGDIVVITVMEKESVGGQP
jgi:Domain of unknown function (DUF4258)